MCDQYECMCTETRVLTMPLCSPVLVLSCFLAVFLTCTPAWLAPNTILQQLKQRSVSVRVLGVLSVWCCPLNTCIDSLRVLTPLSKMKILLEPVFLFLMNVTVRTCTFVQYPPPPLLLLLSPSPCHACHV